MVVVTWGRDGAGGDEKGRPPFLSRAGRAALCAEGPRPGRLAENPEGDTDGDSSLGTDGRVCDSVAISRTSGGRLPAPLSGEDLRTTALGPTPTLPLLAVACNL